VQAHGHAGQHFSAQVVVAFEFIVHGGLRDMQQQGVGQRLGKDDVGLVHEHDGLAETLPLGKDFDNLFTALL